MPASKCLIILALVVVLSLSEALPINSTNVEMVSSLALLSHPTSSSLDASLQWLSAKQYSNGSYGAYEEHWTAAAAYALWLNDTGSANAAMSYSWLASQLDSSSAWFWGAEADVPGAVLFSIASSHNLNLVNTSFAAANLLQLQQPGSGFEGYYDSASGETVTSSVDTDMALLGLISAAAIPKTNQTYATQYLLSLQNQDGSFNLTRSISSAPIDALGPDPVSTTALTVLALEYSGLTLANSSITNGLRFLSREASEGFGGHLYGAAVSDIAFKAYDQVNEAISTTLFILSQQNCDGGFSDIDRSSYTQSNAYDTGWATAALETELPGETGNPLVNSHRPNCAPVAIFLINPSTATVGSTVLFNASASHDPDDDQLLYNWTFGDGHSAQGISATHTFTTSGNFTVGLTVTDSGNDPGPLSTTTTQTVTVLQPAVQKSPSLPFSFSLPAILAIVAGVVALIALIGGAFYLRHRSGRRSAQPPLSQNRFAKKLGREASLLLV